MNYETPKATVIGQAPAGEASSSPSTFRNELLRRMSAEDLALLEPGLHPVDLPLRMSLVTPGIRPAGANVGDQKRIMTPTRAINAGADYLVVGRPIVEASDPKAVAESIAAEITQALG